MLSEVSRHRMFLKHPMSNRDEFYLGKRNRFCEYKTRRGNNHSPLQIFVNEPYWDFSLR
jgi:hypothetical protein